MEWRRETQAQASEDLLYAVQLGDVAGARSCLARGANPNATTRPPERLTLWHRLLDRVRALRTGYSSDRPALWLAASSKHPHELVKLLLEHGADVRGRHPAFSPLEVAAQRGDRATIQLLLDHGAKLADAPGALYWAASGGDIATVRLLLQCGANVNARGILGFPPLMGAVQSAKPELVQLLIDRGADVRATVPAGHMMGVDTPLSLARQQHQNLIIRILTKAGATR